MYRDPSEFRERFKAYKEGKSVREIYGLPGYNNGKFDAATKKKIDYYYNELIANGFDPMSAAGILGNMMQESSLDPDSVNELGYSGLLQNSKAIRQAIIDQYGDYSEQSQLRYLSDWTDGSTWIRKGPHAQHTALYSKSYQRKGYKTPEEAAFQFLKRYERAIVVDPKTKKALRDKNGEYIYQDKDKRLGYARDIYDYVTGNRSVQQQIDKVGKTQPERIVAAQDVTRVATIPTVKQQTVPSTWMQQATELPNYTLEQNFELNKPLNIQRLVDAIDAYTPTWEGLKQSYSNGKLPGYKDGKEDESKPNVFRTPEGKYVNDKNQPLQVLNTLGQDNPKYFTYIDENGLHYTPKHKPKEGTIRQGTKGSGYDMLVAASNQYYNNPILGAPARFDANGIQYLKDIPMSPFGLIESIKNIGERRGTILDFANVAGSFVGGLALGKYLKPSGTKLDFSKMDARQLGQYIFDEHPELLREVVNPHVMKNADVANKQMVHAIENRIKEFAKEGKTISENALDVFGQPKMYEFNLNQYTPFGALYSPSRKAVAFNADKQLNPQLKTYAYFHELWHDNQNTMQSLFGRPYPMQYYMDMQKNFSLSPEYMLSHPTVSYAMEQDAVANGIKTLMANDLGIAGQQLNARIPYIPYQQHAKYYMDAYANDILQHDPGLVRATQFLQRHKNGKLPGYSNGKIRIKPSKRGTFTAEAKKHGASVREFESRVLKNPEKYSTAMVKKARFSRNARSWKH